MPSFSPTRKKIPVSFFLFCLCLGFGFFLLCVWFFFFFFFLLCGVSFFCVCRILCAGHLENAPASLPLPMGHPPTPSHLENPGQRLQAPTQSGTKKPARYFFLSTSFSPLILFQPTILKLYVPPMPPRIIGVGKWESPFGPLNLSLFLRT